MRITGSTLCVAFLGIIGGAVIIIPATVSHAIVTTVVERMLDHATDVDDRLQKVERRLELLEGRAVRIKDRLTGLERRQAWAGPTTR